jgi:hypothetical protein
MEITWRVLKNLKIELPYDPAIPYFSIYQKESMSAFNSDNCTPVHAHCDIVHKKQVMDSAWVPINGWTDKENVVYIHDYVLLIHKGNKHYIQWRKMHGIGDHIKQNESDWER